MSEYSPRPAIRVTVWGENLHEQRDEPVRKLPGGMHNTIAGIIDNLGERRPCGRLRSTSPSTGLATRSWRGRTF